jgi:ribonucleoside-diphosphate reductase alpha chain
LRIERRYTTEARGAYEGLAFREASPHDLARPGSATVAAAVTVPKPWSEAAAAALVRECLARSGVPARLKRVEEPGIPAFLRRSAASETLMADLAEADRFAGESDARQFFDRFAGQLAYAGWKSGCFDGESDARAFMDEIRFTLATQKAAPEADLVRPAGLFWAYGMIDPPAPATSPAVPASPARLLVAAPPADDATPAIDAEDAIAIAAAGGVLLRFTAAT